VRYISELQSVVQSRRDQDKVGTFVIHNQLQEISNPQSVNNQRKDVIGGI
jgi:hypothetical protein